MNFELYVIDTETTGLNPIKNEPVEISIFRLSTGAQKTWCLKPINVDNIEQGALRVNGLKLEDLQGLTKDGREKYLSPNKVLVDIENWVNEDNLPTSQRLMVGQNVSFDKQMMLSLWEKCGVRDSFPFSDKYSLDTMQIEVVINYCLNTMSEASGYSLSALTKKYGIKNDKAHSAEADVRATKELFTKQIEFIRNKFMK